MAAPRSRELTVSRTADDNARRMSRIECERYEADGEIAQQEAQEPSTATNVGWVVDGKNCRRETT